MNERYPDDASLLALSRDEATGVEYIPTGRSPYFLEFRRLLHRLLLAAARANDLRVYQDGDLTVGVRPGHYVIDGVACQFDGASGLNVPADATSFLWLDDSTAVQCGTSGFPQDRTRFIPLAQVSAGASAITTLLDLRGQALLATCGLASLGIHVTAQDLNQALEGIHSSVSAAALNTLTGGSSQSADPHHTHTQSLQNADQAVFFRLFNYSGGGSANVGLALSLPNRLPDDTVLLPDPATGFLRQRYDGVEYSLVGVLPLQFHHEGQLTETLTGKLLGVAPIDGRVSRVALTIGQNLVTDLGADCLSAAVKVNGIALTSSDPTIRVADGSGFRSTAQGDGEAGAVKTDDTALVRRGDLFTVDLIRNVNGNVNHEAEDVAALVVIRAGGPE